MEDQQSILPKAVTDTLARMYSKEIEGEVAATKYLMSRDQLKALEQEADAAGQTVESLLAQRLIQDPIIDWGGASE